MNLRTFEFRHPLLERILQKEQASGTLRDHPELTAIASHWLQSPHADPICGAAGVGETWRRALAPAHGDSLIPSWVPFPPPPVSSFSFVDLFAGIGGFRIPLQELGGRCVFSCEWDEAAKLTYYRNFGELPFGDIRQFTSTTVSDERLNQMIPDHDVLAAGFPCQPFSLAGVSARRSLGQADGFACEAQGTLFFDIVRIVNVKRPAVLLLENVRNLQSHDGGRTYKIIKETIEQELGYSFYPGLVDSSAVVPQRRKRYYMVCFRDKRIDFKFPSDKLSGPPLPLRLALETTNFLSSYTISDKLWEGHKKRTARNLERGTGFTAFVADLDRPSNTLVARYGKDGKECLVPQPAPHNPRFLTPKECARLQGFPDSYVIPEARSTAYRQFGNSVVVPVVRLIAEAMLSAMRAGEAAQVPKLLSDRQTA